MRLTGAQVEAEFERLLAQEGPLKVSSAARGALRWSCGKLTSSKSGSPGLASRLKLHIWRPKSKV